MGSFIEELMLTIWDARRNFAFALPFALASAVASLVAW